MNTTIELTGFEISYDIESSEVILKGLDADREMQQLNIMIGIDQVQNLINALHVINSITNMK